MFPQLFSCKYMRSQSVAQIYFTNRIPLLRRRSPGQNPGLQLYMCPRRESNPYFRCGKQDFKSCASTSSATRATDFS